MAAGRPQSLVATCDQWHRSTHDHTALDPATGDLLLSWTEPDGVDGEGGCTPGRGRAIDRLCRVYVAHAERVDRIDVGPTVEPIDYHGQPPPVAIIGRDVAEAVADETPGAFARRPRGAFVDAAGIAVDDTDRLYVGDRGRATISVLDLWSRRLLRSVPTATSGSPRRHPVAVAASGSEVFAILDDPLGIVRLSATRGPTDVALPTSVASLQAPVTAISIAVLDSGAPVVLVADGNGVGWLATDGYGAHAVGPSTAIAVDGDGAVVVAPCPSAAARAALRRWYPHSTEWQEAMPLDATGYDGGGLVSTAQGRIGFVTDSGFRLAVSKPVTFATEGSCTTYRLDSGRPRNTWGRIFVETCLPEGTEVFVGTATSDDEHASEIARVAAEPAACSPVGDLSLSPPLPPERLRPTATGRLHRRSDASSPWWYRSDRYVTLEAPVAAPAGRYLWITLRLAGRNRRSPRVRELRVEQTGHLLLRRLPEIFSGRAEEADFLRRYLSPIDGLLHDLDVRSRCREILVDPHGTPAEALDWLASFLGLVLDERWAIEARRQLVAEIAELYRRRGTLGALSRYIEIYLAGDRAAATDQDRIADPWVRPVIVEHFRLRGLGGPLLGNDTTASSRSVLGAGFRVGGGVGDLQERFLDPTEDAATSFARHAHRFTVLIPRPLSHDEELVVRHVLDTERPAHTAYELCTVDAGMRVGRGVHVGLSSIVGPTGAFSPLVTDRTRVGHDAIVGGRSSGVAVEAARLGTTARVG